MDEIASKIRKNIAEQLNCHPPRAQQFLVYLTLSEWVGTSGQFITSLAALHRLALFLLGADQVNGGTEQIFVLTFIFCVKVCDSETVC